jgi:hypothetical protein
MSNARCACPATPQSLLRQDESVAGSADQVVGRHPAVAKDDFRMIAGVSEFGDRMGHRSDVPDDLHAGSSLGHHEHGGVLVGPVFRVRLGKHENHIRHRGIGDEPFVAIDHPLVTVAFGRRADHGGIGPRIEWLSKGEGARDLPAKVGPQPPLLLGISGPVGQQLHVPAVGRLDSEDRHGVHAASDDFGHQRQLELTEATSAQLRVQERSPQPALLDLFLKVGFDDSPLVGWQLSQNGFEGDQFTVDERPHPLQLLFEFWF